MINKELTLKIGGEAGYGVMSAGSTFAKGCLRSGYFTVGNVTYPSLVRGGHNTCTVRVAQEEIFSITKQVDFLIAFNDNAIDFHQKELSKQAEILIDADKVDSKKIKNFKYYPIPLNSLVESIKAPKIVKNNIVIGAAFYLLGGDLKILESVIKDIFSSPKKLAVREVNIKAVRLGFGFAKKNFSISEISSISLKKVKKPVMLISGNDAMCLGAVQAGCKFFVAYPMTPMNSFIRFFAKKGPKLGVIFKQPEDELAAINIAIGAAFTGVRSMTATSGGGFSLMVESYGLAGMTETPLVIIEGQRPGPATGLPTWGGQGDLRFILHAAQDEFPRIVIAPGDPEECFYLTAEAFNLAEKYQTPVVVITDTHLAEGLFAIKKLNPSKIKIERGSLLTAKEQKKPYKRYQITSSGISPRALPGRAGFTFIANSDEHNELGYSEEDAVNRIAMMKKRMRKLETCQKNVPNPNIYGSKTAKITLISWGSNKGPILEAQKILLREGIKTQFLHITYLNPLPKRFLTNFFNKTKNNSTLIIEGNFTAQFAGLLKEKIDFVSENHLLKYDGRAFLPEEIVNKVKTL